MNERAPVSAYYVLYGMLNTCIRRHNHTVDLHIYKQVFSTCVIRAGTDVPDHYLDDLLSKQRNIWLFCDYVIK